MQNLTPKQIEDAKKSTTDYLAASIGMGNRAQVENCRVILAALNAYPKLAELEAALETSRQTKLEIGCDAASLREIAARYKQANEAAEAKLAKVRDLIEELEIAKACAAGPGPLGAFHLAQTRLKQILDGS